MYGLHSAEIAHWVCVWFLWSGEMRETPWKWIGVGQRKVRETKLAPEFARICHFDIRISKRILGVGTGV